MKPEIMRQIRVVSLSIIGVAATIGIALAVGLILLAETPPMSLADHIDAETATLFIATDNREEFSMLLNRFQKMFGSSLPALSEIPIANRYEAGVTRSSLGSSWTVYAHDHPSRTFAVITSDVGSSMLLTTSEKKRSLAQTQNFRQNAPEDGSSVLWLDTDALMLPETPAGSVTRAIIAPYSGAFSVWREPGKGILTLISDERHPRRNAPPSIATHLPSKPSFLIEAGNPAESLRQLALHLEDIDPPLKEGLEGVVQERIRSSIGQTSLQQVVDSFVAGPLSLAIINGSGGRQSFVISGTAASPEHLKKGLEMMAAVSAEAIVRHVQFFDGENSRTDVVVGIGDMKEEMSSGGWTLLTMGSGSTTHISGARKGRQYILGNDASLVRSVVMSMESGRFDMDSVRGSIDTAWVRTETGQAFPFLIDGWEDALRLLIGSNISRIGWRASPSMSGVRVEWETEALANPS